jgi:hypothetical protein
MQNIKYDSPRVVNAESVEKIIEAAREEPYVDKGSEYAEKKGGEKNRQGYDKSVLKPYLTEKKEDSGEKRPIYEIGNEPSAKPPNERLKANEKNGAHKARRAEDVRINGNKKAHHLYVRHGGEGKLCALYARRHHSDKGGILYRSFSPSHPQLISPM